MQFFKAVSNINIEETKRLIAEKNFNGILERDEEKRTLLHIIIQKYSENSLELLKLLLKLKKIDINAQDVKGWTPLHNAVAKGRIELCLELLNQRNLKIDAVNNDDNNALMLLCKSKKDFSQEVRYSILLKLLSNVDLDYKNKYGESALHYAAKRGNRYAVQFLCSHNCNIDPLNDKYETPLVYAVRNIQTEIVKILLEFGADTYISTFDGISLQNIITTEEIHLLLRGFRPKDFVFKSKMKELQDINEQVLDQLNELEEPKKKSSEAPIRKERRTIRQSSSIKKQNNIKKNFQVFFDDFQVCERLHYQFYLIRSGGWQCVMKRIDCNDTISARSLFNDLYAIFDEIHHPNLLTYLFHDCIDSSIRIFTNLPSLSLEDYIRQRRDSENELQPEEIQKIALDIALAIDHLHSNHILLRNLKSSSVFLIYNEKNEIDRVLLSFFYASKKVSPWLVSEKNLDFFEPIYYFPNEMRKNLPSSSSLFSFDFTAKSDIWAFGILLFELLTLLPPYRECPTSDHIIEVMKSQRPIIPFSILNREISSLQNSANYHSKSSHSLPHSSSHSPPPSSSSSPPHSSSHSPPHSSSSSSSSSEPFFSRYQNIFDLFEACTQIDPSQRPSIDQIVKALSGDVNINDLAGYKLQQDTNQMQALLEWNSKNFSTSKCFLPTIQESSLIRHANGYIIEAPLPEGLNNPSFIQFYEENIPYYSLGLYPKLHENYRVITSDGGCLLISIESEPSIDDDLNNGSNHLSNSNHHININYPNNSPANHSSYLNNYQFKAIIRSVTEDIRVTIQCDHPKDRLKALKLLFPALENIKSMDLIKDPSLTTSLLDLENSLLQSSKYKFGILYRKKAQIYDDDIYSNINGSIAFYEFIELLGDKINLKGWNKFRGGLDVHNDSTGTHSIYTSLNNFEILFHIASFLPFDPDNRQQLQRKCHLGNDVVVCIFQDDDADPFTPANFQSQFNHTFVVIQPVYKPDNVGPPGRSGAFAYRIGFTFKDRIKLRPRPFLQDPCLLYPDRKSIEKFLTKLINCERVSVKSEDFQKRLQFVRTSLFNDIFSKYDTANKMGTIRKMGKTLRNVV